MTMIIASTWTEARIETLKTLWAKGERVARIAAALDVTRDAVIGKASRLGLGPHLNQHNQARPVNNESNIRLAGGVFIPRTIPTKPRPAEPAPPNTKHQCSIVALRNHSCRWPIGEPGTKDFHFCGDPSADLANGKPYCAYHHKLSRVRAHKPSGG